MNLILSSIKSKLNRVMTSAEIVHNETGENKYYLFCDLLYNWFRFGCSDEDYLTMEFYRKNSREKRRWMTSKKNNRWLVKKAYDEYAINTFDNKDCFDKVFKDYMKHDFIITQESSRSEILAFIERYEQVIVKPSGGACGIGVYKVDSNDNVALESLLHEIELGNNLILEEVIVQHPDMATMNPAAVNTIRVITMLDKDNNVHIIETQAKFGSSDKCISNTLGGGVCCHIDMDSGIISGKGFTMFGDKLFRHPSTGVIIPGFRIPCWNGVCDFAKTLARVVPSAKYIGWDIVVRNDGTYDVIEGNIHPAQDFQAADGKGRWKEIKAML